MPRSSAANPPPNKRIHSACTYLKIDETQPKGSTEGGELFFARRTYCCKLSTSMNSSASNPGHSLPPPFRSPIHRYPRTVSTTSTIIRRRRATNTCTEHFVASLIALLPTESLRWSHCFPLKVFVDRTASNWKSYPLKVKWVVSTHLTVPPHNPEDKN